MAGNKRIQKYEKFGLQLTQAERKLILDAGAALPKDFTQVIGSTPARQPIMMTLDDWREIVEHVASEANDAGDKRLQKKLDAIVLKVQKLLDANAVDAVPTSLEIRQPLADESVQLAEWAARMLIGVEQLGIKFKPVARFPVPRSQRAILTRLPIISANLEGKLAEEEPHVTVGDVGGLLIAVCEALLDAPPLQQFALILVAKNLKECLEAEVNGEMNPGADLSDSGEQQE
jgi:hypothetical protein